MAGKKLMMNAGSRLLLSRYEDTMLMLMLNMLILNLYHDPLMKKK
jgi:hypothetical protein